MYSQIMKSDVLWVGFFLYILVCRRQEGWELKGEVTIVTYWTIEIGLKNGMSEVNMSLLSRSFCRCAI